MNDVQNSIKLNSTIDHSKSKNNQLPKMVQQTDSFPADSSKNKKNGTEKKTNENHTKRPKSLCYDFKKGNCPRRFCRYPHALSFDQVVFCHDFQNNGCFRHNCKFIHRSIEDEEHYRQYGLFPLPQERQRQAVQPQPPDGHQMSSSLAPPPSQLNFYSNRENAMISNQHSGQVFQPNHNNTNNNPMPQSMVCRRRSFCMSENDQGIPTAKRQHIDDMQFRNGYMDSNVHNSAPAPVQCNMQTPNVPTPPQVASVMIGEDVINIYRLYEEHISLRRRVDINEERLQEIRATNAYLLQQNEQLRRQTRCSCTSTIVNPVTLTTATAGTQVLNAVSIAPVQVQATPIVSIASIAGQPQTQIIASSAPLALAASTTQGQQIALASTGQTVQILGTPQITPASAPSMGITLNTSQPLTMSANATQPIISYPIMTHSILPH